MNFLDIKITVFENVRAKTGKDVSLGEFLNDSSQRGLIDRIRNTDDKEQRRYLKSQLRCATISARCPEGRKESDAFQHTGLVCIDIDAQDNPGIRDVLEMKSRICRVSEVLYCSLSVSGKGCFAIFRLKNPQDFKEHFRALNRQFLQQLGLQIDTQCSNIKRLRYASFDPEPYINPEAPPFEIIDEDDSLNEMPPNCHHDKLWAPANRINDKSVSRNRGMSDYEKAEAYVRVLEQTGTDITMGYDQWLKVGMALSNLGEGGRSLFHRVSRMNPGYKEHESDRKFDELLRSTRNVHIQTFFYICNQYDINLQK